MRLNPISSAADTSERHSDLQSLIENIHGDDYHAFHITLDSGVVDHACPDVAGEPYIASNKTESCSARWGSIRHGNAGHGGEHMP